MNKFYVVVISIIVGVLAFRTPVFGNSSIIIGLIAAGVLFLLARSVVMNRTPIGGQMVAGHVSASELKFVRRHEGGHASVGELTGARIVSIQTFSDGSGLVRARYPKDTPNLAVKVGAFYLGGQEAVNSQRGCSHDNTQFRKIARMIPSNQRSEFSRECRKVARNNLGRVNHWMEKVEHRNGSNGL